MPIESKGEAKIVFVRDGGHVGSGCFYTVAIDKAVVGKLETGEQLNVGVKPGVRRVGVTGEIGSLLCEGFGWDEIETTIEQDQVQYFRVGHYISPATWIPIFGLFAESKQYIRPYDQEYQTRKKSSNKLAQQQVSEPPKDGGKSTKRRLRHIQSLHNLGLLSADEYDSKRQTILDEL